MHKNLSLFNIYWRYRHSIQILAVREIGSRYTGSMLGPIWNLIHPTVMVFIYWLIFSVGFKLKPSSGVSFLSWFICAFVIWQIFSDALAGSSASLIRNSNLIKKTVFPAQILPLISLIAALVNGLLLVLLMFAVFYIQGTPVSFWAPQALYYLFALSVLCLGMGLFFSAVTVLLRDMSQIVTVFLQILFWSTPIFYQVDFFPEKWRFLFFFNPIYYLTKGFRDSFLLGEPFWAQPVQAIWYWVIALSALLFGAFFFRHVQSELVDNL